jgi:hypothetical protein
MISAIQDFEIICKEHGFEYDFSRKGSYYTKWETSQAFALYCLAREEGRKDER